MTTEPMLALARQAIAIVMSHVRVTTCGATALNVGDVEKELVAALSRTPPVDQDEVERVARAIETEIEEQTGGAWPIKVGDDLHLVDAELDLRAIARAALGAGDVREALAMACKMLDEGGFAYPAEWLELSTGSGER